MLLVRGVGLGCSMMPTMASAYAVLRRDQVPGGTSILNTLQRLGGSIGTALLAVVLTDQARAALGSPAGSSGVLQTLSPTVRVRVAGPLASAFGHTFWWALGATLVALIPASVLVATQRRDRRAMAARPAGSREQRLPTGEQSHAAAAKPASQISEPSAMLTAQYAGE